MTQNANNSAAKAVMVFLKLLEKGEAMAAARAAKNAIPFVENVLQREIAKSSEGRFYTAAVCGTLNFYAGNKVRAAELYEFAAKSEDPVVSQMVEIGMEDIGTSKVLQ